MSNHLLLFHKYCNDNLLQKVTIYRFIYLYIFQRLSSGSWQKNLFFNYSKWQIFAERITTNLIRYWVSNLWDKINIFWIKSKLKLKLQSENELKREESQSKANEPYSGDDDIFKIFLMKGRQTIDLVIYCDSGYFYFFFCLCFCSAFLYFW